jgi:hypothetical protein
MTRPRCRFHVFQCHNSADKEAVRRICRKLEQHGLHTWLDDEQIRPGVPWQAALEKQIKTIGAAAVFVGKSNMGPWQRAELRVLIDEFVARRCPVIPVLLRGARRAPRLPPFLRAMQWVDFRRNPRRAILLLVWGITDRRPAGLNSAGRKSRPRADAVRSTRRRR